MTVIDFPSRNCSSCGLPNSAKVDLVDLDTQSAAGAIYLCQRCQPLDEDGLRSLLDERDAEIAQLKAALVANTKSAPQKATSHNIGEMLPNGDAAVCGADTGASAFTPAK